MTRPKNVRAKSDDEIADYLHDGTTTMDSRMVGEAVLRLEKRATKVGDRADAKLLWGVLEAAFRRGFHAGADRALYEKKGAGGLQHGPPHEMAAWDEWQSAINREPARDDSST